MSIITTEKIYKECLNQPWAVGGFIGYNMEIMEANVAAAYREGAPALIQNSCRAIDYSGAKMLRLMADELSDRYGIDVMLHLDHGDTVERCFECIDAGFSSVMLDCSDDSFEEKIKKTKLVVEYAHRAGAVVEGEVFHKVESPQKVWSDVDECVSFYEQTGCDSLSISCGNAHGLPKDFQKKLDVQQIAAIHDAIPSVPLVLHATSIFTDSFMHRVNSSGVFFPQRHNFLLQDLQESYQYGVCKVNSALDIKLLYTAAIREYLSANPAESDPRKYLGYAKEETTYYIQEKHRSVFLDSRKL